MKYTIGCESNGKKHPYYGKIMSNNFDAIYIFPFYGKLMGKPMHFPYDEVYHKMGI